MDQNEINQKLAQLEKSGILGKVLFFNSFLTPKVITFIYWLGLLACILMALYALFNGAIVNAILTLIFGPIVVRLYSELIMVVFKNNEYLKDIAQNTRK